MNLKKRGCQNHGTLGVIAKFGGKMKTGLSFCVQEIDICSVGKKFVYDLCVAIFCCTVKVCFALMIGSVYHMAPLHNEEGKKLVFFFLLLS